MKMLQRIVFTRAKRAINGLSPLEFDGRLAIVEKKMSGRLVLGLTSVAIYRRPRKPYLSARPGSCCSSILSTPTAAQSGELHAKPALSPPGIRQNPDHLAFSAT